MLGWMVPNFAARLWSEFRIDWMGCDPSSYLHRAVGREDKALFNSISSHQNVDYNIKDYDGSSILFRLLSKKDYAWAKEAISLGAKIAEDENGAVELFMSAAKSGDEDAISILVDTMHFDVDLKDSAGLTAVYHAVSNNQKSLLKLILTYGPDISISDSGLLTLVHRAAQNGSEDMIKILIKYSPESMRADLKDASGLTPLYYALNNNHCKTAELLESHGAELHFVHEAEKELLNKATANGWLDAVLFLCQRGADVNHVGKNGMPPMLEALKAKHFEIVGALKSHGASHNVKDDQGNTSAHYAVKSSEMLEQIVKEGAKFDQPNNAGKTPLFVAVANANSGHKDAPALIKSAKFLFSKGCKIDFAKPENAALLADNKGKEMFELLMKNGGKEGLNIMDAANKNSLHKALEGRDFDHVDRLDKAGAKLNLDDVRIANMPIQLAKEGSKDAPKIVGFLYTKGLSIDWSQVMNAALLNSNNTNKTSFNVAEELRKHGVKADWKNSEMQEWFVQASRALDSKALKKLCEDYKADVYARDSQGNNAIYYAVKNDKVDALKVLMSFADIKKIGFNPYPIAIDNGSVEVIKALPKEAINKSDDQSKYTPLTYAITKGKIKVAEQLTLDTNVDVNIKDEHGYAPIHYALRTNNAFLMKALISRHVSLDVKGQDGLSAIDIIKAMTPVAISEKQDVLAVLVEYKPEIKKYIEDIQGAAYKEFLDAQARFLKAQEEAKLKEEQKKAEEINSKIPAFNPKSLEQDNVYSSVEPSAPQDDEVHFPEACYYYPEGNEPSAPAEHEDSIPPVNPEWVADGSARLSTDVPPYNPELQEQNGNPGNAPSPFNPESEGVLHTVPSAPVDSAEQQS